MSELKIIPINELYEHPDNPRKDIGDVTELAESLRANGLLQYLTVIPGHWMTKSEYLDMAKREGVAKVDAVGSYDRENSFTPAGYTIIIGHRRFNAAKIAGLTELPCVVVAMTEKEQIGTMLTENMQRSDLTLYEEAKGFQMMINLGSTVADVAQMAGFSETTVRRRAKLAELDEKKFKKAVDRGATLFDFAELDKIEDPEVKDELLAVMGTNDFKNKLSSALSDQKKRKLIDQRIMETLESVGIAGKATSRTCQLSEGEQQRVGIARALLNSPELILADEPTGNLDPITSSEIMQLLVETSRASGIAMLISTHDFMMIDKFQARVVCCENGTVVDPQ